MVYELRLRTGDTRTTCRACGDTATFNSPDAVDEALQWGQSHRNPVISAVQILTDTGTLIGWATP